MGSSSSKSREVVMSPESRRSVSRNVFQDNCIINISSSSSFNGNSDTDDDDVTSRFQGLVYLIMSNSSNVFSKSKMTKSFSFKPARSVSIHRMFAAIAEMPSGGEESPSSSSRGMRSFWTSEEDLFKFD
ncbi:hypothetical protein Tco_0763568 [Tanacetum coccineum]